MIYKILLLSIPFSSLLHHEEDEINRRIPVRLNSCIAVRCPVEKVQDSLPALHSFKNDDIDTVVTSFKDQTLTVKLKGGLVYIYQKPDWDGKYNRACDDKVDAAMGVLTRIFTRTEKAPVFPGGKEGWDAYIGKVCSENAQLIKEEGAADIFVQFVVDVNGEISQVSLIKNDMNPKLADLAKKTLLESSPWQPATQNGHKVICYQRQVISFR